MYISDGDYYIRTFYEGGTMSDEQVTFQPGFKYPEQLEFDFMKEIMTKDGLIYKYGRVLSCFKADREAEKYGLVYAERLVEHLINEENKQ